MIRSTLAALALSALAGCATVIHGTTQDVQIESAPAGAKITVDGRAVASSPAVMKLSRNADHTVRIELNGYQPFDVTLHRRVSGWVFVNLATIGVIGIAIDAIDGAMFNLTPEQITAQLEKQSAQVTTTESGLYVVVVLRPDPAWQPIGTLVHQ